MKTSFYNLLVTLFTLVLSVFITGVALAQPAVNGSTPSRNAVNVAFNANINIAFNQTMDATTLNENTVLVFGSYRGAYSGAISYSGTTAVFNPDVDFMPGEVITVTVTTGAKNTSDVAMARSFTFNFTAAAQGDGLFMPEVNFAAVPSSQAIDVVAADLNGNGNMDLAVLSQGNNSISVHFSNGDGTFAAPVVLTTANIPMRLLAEDVNGDGIPDLVVANVAAFSMSVFINNGDNTFASRADYGTPMSLPASDMVVMDLTGNGNLDVVQLHLGNPGPSQYLFLFENNGDGTFGTATQYTIADLNSGGSLAVSFHSSDLTSNNWRPHLLVTDYSSNQLRVYESYGSGNSFDFAQTRFAGTNPVNAASFRLLSTTPHTDAVVLNSGSDNITVYSTSGGFAFGQQSNFSVGDYPNAIAGGDLDGDGDIDLIVVNDTDGNLSYLPNSSGTFFTNNLIAVAGNPTQVKLADMSGNGKLDIITTNTNGTVSIFYNYPGPEITSTTPANNATGVDAFSNIQIEFSVDFMDATTMNATNIVVLDAESAVIPSTFDLVGSTLTITPDAPFQQNTSVSVEVTANVKSNTGLSIINPTTFSFQVAESFASIVSVNPTANALFDPAFGSLSIEFAGDMKLSSIENGVQVIGSARGAYSGSWGFNSVTNIATFTPTLGFIAGETISVIVGTSVETTIGGFLAEQFQWSFVIDAAGDGSFTQGSAIGTGFSNPSVVKIADMNGDGIVDIVATGYDSGLTTSVVSVSLNDGLGGYNAPVITDLGTDRAANFTIADFDGDGNADIAVVHKAGANMVSFHFGDGLGGFATPVTYTVTEWELDFLASGDLTGNGLIDLAVTRYSSSQVVILQNNGDRTFTPQTPITSGGGAWDILTVDVNNDGHLDIVTGDYDDGTISVLMNNGDGTFAPKVSYAAGQYVAFMAAGDVNGNGFIDIVADDYGDGNFFVMLNDGNGVFSLGSTLNVNGFKPSLVKTKGDGNLDLVAVNSGNIVVFEGNGDGTFNSSSKTISIPGWTQSFTALDMDGDNDVDLVALSDDGNAYTMLNVEPTTVVSTSPSANALNIAAASTISATFSVDMDATTLTASNIVVQSDKRGIISGTLNYNAGTRTVTFTPTLNYLTGEVISVNIKKDAESADGIPLESGLFFSFTAEAEGFGFFEKEIGFELSASLFQTHSADMTGNGSVDLITGSAAGIHVYQNDGSGGFTEISSIPVPSFNKFWVHDINQNGSLDIIVKRDSDNNIYFFINDGTGGFVETDYTLVNNVFLNAISFPYDLAFADFNGNGLEDVVYTSTSFSNARVQIRTGDFTFGSTTFIGSNGGYALKVADLNNDGIPDIVWSGGGNSEGVVHIALGQGGGSFATTVTRDVGARPEAIVAADLTGNGYLDIATADRNGGSYSVIRNNSGTFDPAVIYKVSDFEPRGIFAADVDGDGDLDLLVSGNLGIPKVLVAYNDGNAGLGNQLFYGYNADDAPDNHEGPQHISVFDVNGNGLLDVAGHVYARGTNTHKIGFLKNVSAGAGTAPTVAASNPSVSNIDFASATLNWTNGDGQRRLVVVKQGSPVDATLSDDAGYSANPAFGSGTEIGTGNFVVYGGAGNSVTITGLDAETNYHFAVYETNGIPGQEKIFTAGAPTFSFTSGDAPILWDVNVSSVTITKANYADWTLEANQDRLAHNIWLTRADNEGLINAAQIGIWDSGVSPRGTLWAQGTTADVGSLTFTTLFDAVGGSLGSNLVGTDLVMYLVGYNIYVDINFSSWTGSNSGGGFTYTRGAGVFPTQPDLDFNTVAGNAVAFDASQSQNLYMEMKDGFNEVLPRTTTVEFWAKPSALDVIQTMFSFRNRFSVGLNASNQFVAHNQRAAGDIVSSVTATAGQWYHIAVTAKYNGQLKLYINGVLQGEQSIIDSDVSGYQWYVGSGRGSDYFTGVIDEFLVWNTIRSESEIRSGMHSTLSGNGEGVYMYFQFNESSGNPVTLLDDLVRIESFNGTYVTSDAPIGQGTSTIVAGVQSGTTIIGNTSLNLTTPFENPVDVVVTEVTTVPNVYPEGISASLGGKYFVIDLFGDPGVFSADLTLTFGEGAVSLAQEANPGSLKLYRRDSNSSGAWTEIASAVSAVSSTGAVTWSGITSFSQFMAGEVEAGIGIDDKTITIYDENSFSFPSDFFDFTGAFDGATLTVTADVTTYGTLFVDENENGIYDDGTDLLLVENTGVSYTANSNKALIYIPSGLGMESVTLTFSNGTDTDAVTLSFLTVMGSPTIEGIANEGGWYLLSNPMDNAIGVMLDNLWTQGAVNSDAPAADATLYTFSQDNSQYQAITTDLDTTKLAAGQGLLAYIFAFDDYNAGVPVGGGWPKMLTNFGNPFGTDISVPVKNVDHDGIAGTTGSEGFVLLGNPYGWPMSADSVISKLKREDPLANSYVYRWNPVQKVFQLASTGSIDPYESFFVRVVTSGLSAILNFDYGDAAVATQSKASEEKNVEFVIKHVESGLESASYLRFDENGKESIDPYDGYYLGSYASKYANLYTLVGDQRLTINNVPANGVYELEYPIYLDATKDGEFTLTWDETSFPEGIEATLKHLESGDQFSLNSENSYSFTTSKSSVSKMAEDSFNSPLSRGLTYHAKNQLNGPTFMLTLFSNLSTTTETDYGIPTEVELYQNYPNPFNPTSMIRFGVPESQKVKLEVFDILGRRVMTLIDNEIKSPGRYSVQFDAHSLSSGIYIYRLVVGDKVMSKKMTLIK